jgi:hypothetical protein
VLQRQHVQRIGKDEPVGDSTAENVARPVSRAGVSRSDGAKQRLGLGAVLADPLGPQFVMKLLVHGSSQPPGVRFSGREVPGLRMTWDRYARWAEPSPRTGGALAHRFESATPRHQRGTVLPSLLAACEGGSSDGSVLGFGT